MDGHVVARFCAAGADRQRSSEERRAGAHHRAAAPPAARCHAGHLPAAGQTHGDMGRVARVQRTGSRRWAAASRPRWCWWGGMRMRRGQARAGQAMSLEQMLLRAPANAATEPTCPQRPPASLETTSRVAVSGRPYYKRATLEDRRAGSGSDAPRWHQVSLCVP